MAYSAEIKSPLDKANLHLVPTPCVNAIQLMDWLVVWKSGLAILQGLSVFINSLIAIALTLRVGIPPGYLTIFTWQKLIGRN